MKTRIKCNNGYFSGYKENSVINFKGIRYAISKRFGSPKMYKYSNNLVEVIEDAPCSVQLNSPVEYILTGIEYEKFVQEENCQYLSISIPANIKETDKVPVMVFFHGGAFRNGGCDSPTYNKDLLVKEGKVIVVGVNYRLNMGGFGINEDEIFSNNGLLDAICALKWIRKNIQFFGGDKNNVTLFGQSAGAELIRSIMLSIGTDDLYKKAIIESDPIGALDRRRIHDKRILKRLKKLDKNMNRKEYLENLSNIMDNMKIFGNSKFLIFSPHYGVYPLPKEKYINKRLKEIASTHDIIVGTNTREASAYLGTKDILIRLYDNPLTKKVINKVLNRKTKEIFINPSLEFAKKYSSYGGNVYYYMFKWNENNYPLGGCHGMELMFLFGTNGQDGLEMMCDKSGEEIEKIGKDIRKVWYTYAKCGKVVNKRIENMLEIKKL